MITDDLLDINIFDSSSSDSHDRSYDSQYDQPQGRFFPKRNDVGSKFSTEEIITLL